MRRSDWKERLTAVITQRAEWPFQWRVHDCISFGNACYEAQTGTSPMPEYDYHDHMTAVERLKEYCGGGVREAITKALGKPTDGEPTDGDVVLCRAPSGEMAGIWAEGAAIVPGPRRLLRLRRDFVLEVWKV